ncbi:hypothetical protein [Streptomyces sp. SID4945]|uniref:hypothetical protein n=1 Tax=Streptomyces sp. SID4945 TaxID=2690285 RepID=UPI00081E7727|nr:hypothetical protein [Streptomyces sp. SID4945]SCD75803.1 hypothetical protein GA0115251_12218 [Streptomyces sp. TverLS-915]SCD94726.1 hypothetical protein GA0115252_125028 [Streptomyces sp. DfronAA-171]SCF37834.1 hypothetical protein GA0115257_114127 [Streptomyces sp. LcepLS]
MSPALTIVLIVVVVVVLAAVAFLLVRRGAGAPGGGSLPRRFGPEYDRAVRHHDGDKRAAEQELRERVKTYGSLHEHTPAPEERTRLLASWSALQERFVEAPREAAAEADRLLAETATAVGHPGADRHAARLDSLSVHHPHHVDGYRRLRAALTPAEGGHESTEELREALLAARGLFEELIGAGTSGTRTGRGAAHHGAHRTERADEGAQGPGTPPAAGTAQAPAPGTAPAPAPEATETYEGHQARRS